MTRALSALLLALGLLLTGACSSNQSGDSNSDTQVDQKPGREGTDPNEESPAP